MSWKFSRAEKSPGQYLCTGQRDSGHVVHAQSEESEIGKAFALAFALETELGTLPSRALFEVAIGAKPTWRSEYCDHAFGSWVVQSPQNSGQRIVYDGKEFWLEIFCGNRRPTWQGAFRVAKDLNNDVFHLLSSEGA